MGGEYARRPVSSILLSDLKPTADEWAQEGTKFHRQRWHNQKYYTWVEQQGKAIDELRALANPDFWLKEQARTPEIDKQLAKARGF